MGDKLLLLLVLFVTIAILATAEPEQQQQQQQQQQKPEEEKQEATKEEKKEAVEKEEEEKNPNPPKPNDLVDPNRHLEGPFENLTPEQIKAHYSKIKEKEERVHLLENPWLVERCEEWSHACRIVLRVGAGSVGVADKACWVHQDSELLEKKEATVICREPKFKCNCTNDEKHVFCSDFMTQVGCKDKDLERGCGSQLSKVMSYFLQRTIRGIAEEELAQGDATLRIKLEGVWWGNYTGHVIPDWLAERFCSYDAKALSEDASQAQQQDQINNARLQQNSLAAKLPEEVGEGWKIVRRVKPGDKWHPAEDHLKGTATYGTFTEDIESDSTFSIAFFDFDFNQFMFATGDMTHWLIANKKQVTATSPEKKKVKIYSSSDKKEKHDGYWVNKPGEPGHPWIAMLDHDESIKSHEMLYGEHGSTEHINYVKSNKGCNVFVRKFIPSADGPSGTEETKKEKKKELNYRDLDESRDTDWPDLIVNLKLDNRPCLNDSHVDDYNIPRGLGVIEPKPPTDIHAIRTLDTGCSDRPEQFDDYFLDGVLCDRSKTKENTKCNEKEKPCGRYKDQLPYYQSKRIPCRKRKEFAFLDNRLPEDDKPDNLRRDLWNQYHDYYIKGPHVPPVDPFVDPDQLHISKEEKRLRRKPIGGENYDKPDLVRAAYVTNKETRDDPHIARPRDMEPYPVAILRYKTEQEEGRELDRIKERKAKEMIEIQRKLAQDREVNRKKREYFVRLEARAARKARAKKALTPIDK